MRKTGCLRRRNGSRTRAGITATSRLQKAYALYEKALTGNNALDFDDLLSENA